MAHEAHHVRQYSAWGPLFIPAYLVASVVAFAVTALVGGFVAVRERKRVRMERAAEQCRLNRGVDCETAEGLQEWLLLRTDRA